MATKFFTAAAYVTLVVDAYLALASIATRMMPRDFQHYLPPFGDGASEGFRTLVLLVATWTSVLALGCLHAARSETNNPHAAGVVWFLLLIVLIWLIVLLPTAIGFLAERFVWGA